MADTHSARQRLFFFFNDTATTEIYTLSLHDALPICLTTDGQTYCWGWNGQGQLGSGTQDDALLPRSEEHTSELQSPCNLVCRLLLEKKKTLTRDLTDSYRTKSNAACGRSLYLKNSLS